MGNSTTPRIIETDTLILGGGVAGIAAAHELESKNHGVKYLLLEAKPYLGGRVYTDEEGDDIGAAWLHSEKAVSNPLQHLARKMTYSLAPENEQTIIIDEGKTVNDETFRKIVEEAYQKLELAAQENKDQTIFEVLQPQSGSLEEKIYIAEFGGAESNLDITQVSAKDFMKINSRTCGALLPQGMGNLFQDYARTLPQEKIHLNTEITQIRWAKYAGGGVVMTARDGTEYHAQNAIITLPIGVLQEKIKDPEYPLPEGLSDAEIAAKMAPFFNPPLPSEKRFAISDIQMGLMNKIVIPLASGDFFDKHKIAPTQHLHIYDTQSGKTEARFYVANPLGKLKFVMLVGGEKAQELEQQGEQAAIDYALEGLRQGFGKEVFTQEIKPQIVREKCKATAWGSDAFARGAYSGGKVGKNAARYFIGKPTGNLFWAGEACRQNGWESHVTGAYYSGSEAAKAAYKHLHKQQEVQR